jgi:hypothetical protein
VLTGAIGLGGALLVVVPFVYSLNLIAGVHVLATRTRFGLARSQAAWLLFDAMLCAPYGANRVKRIVRLQPTLKEGIARLRNRMSGADFERLSGAIALRKTETNTTEE